MTPSSKPGAAVIDSSVLIAICSKETSAETARQAIADYAAAGWTFFAPGVIVAEALFVLCRKQSDGLLSATDYGQAVILLKKHLSPILPPPNGDAALIDRASEIRQGDSCAHSTDCIFIALAEQLAKAGDPVEILTFDKRLGNVAKSAAGVLVRLLPS